MQAFAQVQAGQDEAARETLQPIGLRSPFLEWKVLLRGLIAYYQSDDVRALDNWQRLAGTYHGSGCTLASAIAATIANGVPVTEPVPIHLGDEVTIGHLLAGKLPDEVEALTRSEDAWARR